MGLNASDNYKENSNIGFEYIKDVLSALEGYLPAKVLINEKGEEKDIEIKDIRDLRRFLIRNKEGIFKNIERHSENNIGDFKLLKFGKDVPEDKRKEENQKILKNNDEFIKLCLSIYRLSKGENEKSGAIVADYQERINTITKEKTPRIKERRLSKVVVARYNSGEAIKILEFLKNFLPESEQNTKISEINTLREFIDEHKEDIIKGLKEKGIIEDIAHSTAQPEGSPLDVDSKNKGTKIIVLMLDEIIEILDTEYKRQNSLSFIKKHLPRTTVLIEIEEKLINFYLKRKGSYKILEEIIEANKTEIINDLRRKGIIKNNIVEPDTKSIIKYLADDFFEIDRNKSSDLSETIEKPINSLSVLDGLLDNQTIDLKLYGKVLNLISRSKEKLNMDNFKLFIKNVGVDILSEIIDNLENPDSFIKLINESLSLITSMFNIRTGNSKDFRKKCIIFLTLVDIKKLLKIYNVLKEKVSFGTLIIHIGELKLANIINKTDKCDFIDIFTKKNYLITFLGKLEKDIYNLGDFPKGFFHVENNKNYRKLADIYNQIKTDRFINAINSISVEELFSILDYYNNDTIIKTINGENETRGIDGGILGKFFPKKVLTLDDLYE